MIPSGSLAQQFDFGIPLPSRPASGLAFQGMDQ